MFKEKAKLISDSIRAGIEARLLVDNGSNAAPYAKTTILVLALETATVATALFGC